MKRALSEIEALALKAARGVGIPTGLAEDFARAVRHLAATEPAHLACAVSALADRDVIYAAPVIVDDLRISDADVAVPATMDVIMLRAYLGRASLDFELPLTCAQGVARRGGAIPQPQMGPIDVPAAIWEALNAHAALTYVPATDANRSGAGAGLTDND